jgi:hypothetical protein
MSSCPQRPRVIFIILSITALLALPWSESAKIRIAGGNSITRRSRNGSVQQGVRATRLWRLQICPASPLHPVFFCPAGVSLN